LINPASVMRFMHHASIVMVKIMAAIEVVMLIAVTIALAHFPQFRKDVKRLFLCWPPAREVQNILLGVVAMAGIAIPAVWLGADYFITATFVAAFGWYSLEFCRETKNRTERDYAIAIGIGLSLIVIAATYPRVGLPLLALATLVGIGYWLARRPG